MNKKAVFTGCGTAIITPFDKNNEVNYEKLGELIEYQIANGADAIIACGTTGEASTMPDKEHLSVIEYTINKVNKRIPVIAGTGSNDTIHSRALSQEAKDMGADALLQVTPYYNKTTQSGLIKHFTYLADNVELPMILYNVPGRTGMTITPETYQELSKHPNIVATKEASGNFSAIAKAISLCGENLYFYSGNDDQIVPMLSLGGKGVISVLSNIMPKKTHDICELFFKGKIKESADLQLELMELIDALFIEVNPAPVKNAMNLLGFEVGNLRMPLCDISQKSLNILKTALRNQNFAV